MPLHCSLALSPAILASAALRVTSFLTYASNSLGLMVIGSTAKLANFSRTSVACSALSVSS